MEWQRLLNIAIFFLSREPTSKGSRKIGPCIFLEDDFYKVVHVLIPDLSAIFEFYN